MSFYIASVCIVSVFCYIWFPSQKGHRTTIYSGQQRRLLHSIMWCQTLLTGKSYMICRSKGQPTLACCQIVQEYYAFIPGDGYAETQYRHSVVNFCASFSAFKNSGVLTGKSYIFSLYQFVLCKFICIHSEPFRWVLNGGDCAFKCEMWSVKCEMWNERESLHTSHF